MTGKTPNQWRLDVLDRLSDPDFKLRFLSLQDFAEVASQCGATGWVDDSKRETSKTVRRAVSEMVARGDLVRLQRDLYANMRARPVPVPAEAAHLIRPGAIVSLLSVLGECGVTNNPTNIVYAVFPVAEDKKSSARRTITPAQDHREFGRYRFIATQKEFLDAGLAMDNLAAATYPRATPDRAFIDWLRLAALRNAILPPPPLDCDLELLDLERLTRIADATGMTRELNAWLAKKRDFDAAEEVEEVSAVPGVGR